MKPQWLKKKALFSDGRAVKAQLRALGLNAVCEEAKCPNLGECFSRGTATFMILGDVCTRGCAFCGVKAGMPREIDSAEPFNIAEAVAKLGLNYVVITSVTRDDLPDEGAGHFTEVIRKLKACPEQSRGAQSNVLSKRSESKGSKLKVEVLTPDFHARPDCLAVVCDAGPDVFAHNLETVRRLTAIVRNNADYDRSLKVLGWVHDRYPKIRIKSGIMLGFGETREEIVATLKELRDVGCEIVTIGQYLRPALKNIPVVEYIAPEIFEEYKTIGEGLGIKHVMSGPFVRSSYMAETEELWIAT